MQVSVEHSRSDDGLLKRHRNYKKSVCMYRPYSGCETQIVCNIFLHIVI